MKNYTEKLHASESITDVFGLVKDAVQETISESRAGLDLGFLEMGNTDRCVFAFYPAGSNIIVMNKTPIRRIMETKPELLKPYVFSTLLHEYLHSLGYLDEAQTRRMTCMICSELFGDNIVTELACSIDKYLHYVTYPGGFPQLEREIQVLEVEGQDYIG